MKASTFFLAVITFLASNPGNAALPITIYRAYNLPIGWIGQLKGPSCPANKIAIAANYKVIGGNGNLELLHSIGTIPSEVSAPRDINGPIPISIPLQVRFATMCVDDPYFRR